MLDANLKTQLKSYMEMVSQPIEIVACLDDGAKSRELRELHQEIEGMSDKISLTERNDSDERKQSFTINRSGTDISVRFARSEARRVGKECGRTCRSRWARYH